ncbi:hypothetical protein [Devosia salina]|uniref:CdiI immunity protein domain-containing protein n=1 Tax=Devosia salina TaxID=2860336 RepID=A0ABX8WIX3_9HYPH|nr:hypothetical protein [Devosia salina]QYO77941.1 hypothetical protein K1X15_05070 [Devosia salina]
MGTPASFWALAMRFHQDVPFFVEANEVALADYLVGGLDLEERRALAGFLDVVFAQSDAGVRLLRLWKKSKADFGFAQASDIEKFFVVVRGRL